MEKSPVSSPVRYHGLDALRAIAMALGIVLHAALPYFDTSGFWPSDKGDSNVIWAIFEFIHLWRMPLFFILAGFFAALVVDRRSWRAFWRQRLRRIGLPLLVFLPVIALTMPYIWLYGFKGTFTGYIGSEGYSNPWHLWFLFHLLIFVIFMAIWKLIRQVSSIIVQVQRIRNIWHKSVGAILQVIYFPVPVLLFIRSCSAAHSKWCRIDRKSISRISLLFVRLRAFSSAHSSRGFQAILGDLPRLGHVRLFRLLVGCSAGNRYLQIRWTGRWFGDALHQSQSRLRYCIQPRIYRSCRGSTGRSQS